MENVVNMTKCVGFYDEWRQTLVILILKSNNLNQWLLRKVNEGKALLGHFHSSRRVHEYLIHLEVAAPIHYCISMYYCDTIYFQATAKPLRTTVILINNIVSKITPKEL